MDSTTEMFQPKGKGLDGPRAHAVVRGRTLVAYALALLFVAGAVINRFAQWDSAASPGLVTTFALMLGVGAGWAAGIVGVLRIARALAWSTFTRTCAILLVPVPLVGMAVLLATYAHATGFLKARRPYPAGTAP